MSTETNHTPGPWEWQHDYESSPNWCSIMTKIGNKLTYIADVYRGEADARLIAAAPDMLEALEALLPLAEDFYYDVNHGDEYVEQFVKARAAIAKAKGEQP
jgi:hypothetical protein